MWKITAFKYGTYTEINIYCYDEGGIERRILCEEDSCRLCKAKIPDHIKIQAKLLDPEKWCYLECGK